MSRPDTLMPAPLEAAPVPQVANHTSWPAQYFQHVDPFDEAYHVMVCRITYSLADLEAAGETPPTPVPCPAHAQSPLCESDRFRGAPNASSVIEESDYAPFKPRCDVLVVNAQACSPEGRPRTRWQVGFGFGEAIHKVFQVCGPRRLKKGLTGWQLSAPAPATEVPLVYELAYGGPIVLRAQQLLEQLQAGALTPDEAAQAAGAIEALPEHDAHNPIGCGHSPEPLLHALQPVRALLAARLGLDWPAVLELFSGAPQIEALDTPFTGQKAYPVIGLGPVGRWWAPRLALAGTHDEAWKATQWPRSPRDHDYRYWNCAPEDQQIDYPAGGEVIALANLGRAQGGTGPLRRFALPRQDLQLLVRLEAGPMLFAPMHIDTVIIDLEADTLTVVRRATVSARMPVRKLELGTWPPGTQATATQATATPESAHGR